ncbi:hypothetical protein ABZ807_29295 [Micromonospora sp. NPDC047548]|uniref:hypothetical protein n=1 Tax=Micromonospora sp. NPDC047548 TaxID=3155624 RepID=UPI0033CE1EA0
MAKWWEIMVPAAGALLAGLMGAWLQARSSVKLLKQQSQAELERLAVTQRHEDERRWLEARKETYIGLLSIFEQWTGSLRRWADPLAATLRDGKVVHADERPFDYATAREKMIALDGEMELLASPTTKDAVQQVTAMLLVAEMLRADSDKPGMRGALDSAMDELAKLKNSMRSDLGVVLPSGEANTSPVAAEAEA